jgi:catechol 2,3-dioxygenase-like lactoylglutathione lyase family enzyme
VADGRPIGGFASLVPELAVENIAASLDFWCGPLGFRIAYERPENGFAYLERPEGAQVMLDRRNGHWETGPLERPLGRGINVQIKVAALAPILAALEARGWPLFEPAHEVWYRVGAEAVGCRQLLVQDPDGYLLRFMEDLGWRPAV